jgi:hypothetical protein
MIRSEASRCYSQFPPIRYRRSAMIGKAQLQPRLLAKIGLCALAALAGALFVTRREAPLPLADACVRNAVDAVEAKKDAVESSPATVRVVAKYRALNEFERAIATCGKRHGAPLDPFVAEDAMTYLRMTDW